MGNEDQPLLYRLPRSAVRITGTVTIEVSDMGEPVPKRTSDVSVATEAEPGEPLRLTLDERWGTDRDFDLKFTADQRLSGATSSSTGVGAKVIEAGVRAVSLAAKLLPSFAAALDAAPDNAPRPETVQGALETEQPELAARQRAARERVQRTEEALAKAIDALAAGSSPDGPERLKALDEALAAARHEAARIDAQVAAWRAERFPPWSQTLSYAVGTDELPSRPDPAERTVFTGEELKGDAAEAARKLGVVVTRIDDTVSDSGGGPQDDEGLIYRHPRRVVLAVYEEEPAAASTDDAPASFRLRTLTSAWVVDRRSRRGVIRFRSGLFSSHGATAEFGDAGTLIQLSNKNTSALGSVAGAVSGAGAQIEESLDQAAKIGAALPSDPKRRALQDQVDEKELQARLAKANRTIAGGADA